MAIPTSLTRSLMRRVNPTHRRNGEPFDPATALAPPSGRHSWVHYGVMVPGLPEPHRTFGVMSIVGTPGAAVFANDRSITTTPGDTAYVVSATAAMRGGQFASYSLSRDCTLHDDGSLVRFGDDVVIRGTHPAWTVERHHRDAEVRLQLTATPSVTWFARLPGGLYDHWSLLCRYRGTVDGAAVSGLATLEYARGVGLHSLPVPGTPNAPLRFFTYHVINIDARTQLLFAELHGPAGIVILRKAYVRGTDDPGAEYEHARMTVTRHESDARATPTGTMRLPAVLELTVAGDDGTPLARIEGACHGDWAYGLGAGFVGSYAYRGEFEGRPITGTAYLEYVALGS